MTAPVLAALDTGTTLDDDGRPWPTVVVDVGEHPEVADVARVHAIDGIGDIATEAALVDVAADHRRPGELEQLLALAVIITVPVRVAFAITFALPAQRQVLDDAADAGHLVIATTDPEAAAADRPLWLAVDLDAELLRTVLPEL